MGISTIKQLPSTKSLTTDILHPKASSLDFTKNRLKPCQLIAYESVVKK
jgi:hypothetical protein